MMLVCLLLTAAPVLEPDPGKLPRVQPREVSSIKPQDSAALWAVDDDPATAWKATVKEAALTWGGAYRENATSMKLFIRAGCQDSQDSFAAYARPRHITLTERARHWSRHHMMPPPMILELDGAAPAETKQGAFEAELQDVAGWQSVEVPLASPALRGGFVLKVKDTYAGKAHEELCISDLRVYVDSKDPVDPGEEQLAFNGIKRSITETLARAKIAPRRIPAAFASTEIDVDAPIAAPRAELALESPNTFSSMVKRARQTATEARAAWKVPVAQLEANGWKRASVQSVLDDDGSLESAMVGNENISWLGDSLLAGDDFKLVTAQGPLNGLRALAGKMQKLGEKPLECEAACLPAYASTMTSTLSARSDCQRVCSYGDGMLHEMRADLGGSGIFVKGGLDSPREVLLVSSREGGEREIMRRTQRELFVYANGRVSAIASISFDPRYVETQQLAWNEDRSAVQSVLHITLEGAKVESAMQMSAKEEHAERELDAEGALAFDVQR